MIHLEAYRMRTYCISNPELAYFLERERADSEELDLSRLFRDILARANQFVRSEAGSIFLDTPREDESDEKGPIQLVLVSCFGAKAEGIVGLRLPSHRGIVGQVYQTGRPYVSNDLESDEYFYGRVDETSGFETRSVICVPITIRGRVFGVLELVNHLGGRLYGDTELELIRTFAQTISASLETAVEAHRSKEMARRDELTGLFNDRYLHYRLTDEVGHTIERDDDCGLLFLDLDRFKEINDRYGHLAGSRTLAEIGGILRSVLPGSSIAARYGGDEFVVILPGTSKQEADWVAQTIRKSIEMHVFLEKEDPIDPTNYPALSIGGHVTASIGIASLREDILPLPQENPSPLAAKNELIRIADQRMYRAKELGKNRIASTG